MQSPIGAHVNHWLTSNNALFAGDLERDFFSEGKKRRSKLQGEESSKRDYNALASQHDHI